MPVCSKIPLLYLLTQKVAQKFGYVLGIGDIDIYLAGGRKRVMQYINKVCPNQVVRYHHVDFPVMKTAIEAHFTPSHMFFPVHNHRMQKWFKEVMDLQCSNVVTLLDGYGEITVPTMNFNVIYPLSSLSPCVH